MTYSKAIKRKINSAAGTSLGVVLCAGGIINKENIEQHKEPEIKEGRAKKEDKERIT